MDILKQRKILIRIISSLIVLNLFSIGIIIWVIRSQRPVNQDSAKTSFELSQVLKKELNLNDTQIKQIEAIRSGFYEKETVLAGLIKSQRDSMNLTMFNKDSDDELLRALARRVADNEYQMELYRIDQAKELKAICTPEQLEKLHILMREIRDYLKPDRPKKER